MSLQDKRKEKGLSQSELSNLAGVNIRTLQSYEQGTKNINVAKLETLVSLVQVLECHITDILTDQNLIDRFEATL